MYIFLQSFVGSVGHIHMHTTRALASLTYPQRFLEQV